LSIDGSSGLISGTIAPDAVFGSPYRVTVTASDGEATDSQSFTWTVGTANHAPQLTDPGDQANAIGDTVSLALTAIDADNDPLPYRPVHLPYGLTIDPATGIITGTIAVNPNPPPPGLTVVTVSDGVASDSQAFLWIQHGVGLTNPGDQSGVNGDVVS